MALEKLRSIFQPKGFGDDLGLDDYDLSLPSPSRLTNQNNSTRGFGDDLGLDDFSPNRIRPMSPTPIKPIVNIPRGFGDDLGLIDFDASPPPPLPPTPPKTTQNPVGFGDDLGLDDYDPNRIRPMSPTPIKPIVNIPRGFGDDLGLDDFDASPPPPPPPLPPTPPKTTQNPVGFGDDLGLDDFDPNRTPKFKLFIENRPVDKFDTKLGNFDRPILDTLLRGRVYEPIQFSQNFTNKNLFVGPEQSPFTDLNFRTQTFDPRATTPKEGTLYLNTNNSFNPATNPTDFSTAIGNNDLPYTPLTELGGQFQENLSWENLYNKDHTPIDDPSYKGKSAVNYGPNVNRDKLNIRDSSTKSSIYNFSRKPFLGVGSNEPYIVSDIPQSSSSFTGGRLFNQGPLLGIPINRAITDTLRIGQYLTSPAGVGFILAQNFLGKNTKNIFLGKDGGVFSSEQRFKKAYNPASTLLQTLGRAGFGPVGLLDKTEPDIKSLFGSEKYGSTNVLGGNIPFDVNESYNKGSGGESNAFGFKQFKNELISKFKAGAGVPTTVRETSHGGDVMTLAPMVDGTTLLELDDDFFTREDFEQDHPDIKSEKNGMPFYFKDMRDNTYVFFRAYIEGLTENISPTYASHNYIGRSEPVYTYERAEREISMTLKLVAQTRQELTEIYKKMDRLTSMCYPQYVDEDNPDTTDIREGYGNRMKPPLAKLRYGEMYGKTDKELMGYMKSISYSVEQSSTYETEVGARVPRHVTATIGYQVIHDKAPRLGTTFYGINQNG